MSTVKIEVKLVSQEPGIINRECVRINEVNIFWKQSKGALYEKGVLDSINCNDNVCN